jgi:O-antigen biosynthesis protein
MTRLLYVDAKWPTPGSDAASQRTVQLIAALRRLGFEVDLAALFAQETATDAATPIDTAGAHAVKSPSREAVLQHIARHGSEYDVAVVAWTRVAQQVIGPLRAARPEMVIYFDTNDVNHVREYRHARVSGNANLLRRALAVKAAELSAAAQSDVVIAISHDDGAVFKRELPNSRVQVITLAVEPRPDEPPGPAGRRGGLYLGHYYAMHNVDAASHIVADVLPELERLGCEMPITLAGAGRNELVDGLARKDVTIHGYEADLAALCDRHRLFLGALRIGSGIKGKLLAAMVNGLPVVATPVAIEGFGAEDGRHCLIGSSPAELAAACVRLSRDDELWRRLSLSGRELVAERFSQAEVDLAAGRAFGVSRPADAR